MENSERKSPVPGILLALILGGAFVWATSLLSGAIVRTKSDSEMIRVTGSARKNIQSDFIIWTGRVSYQGVEVAATYEDLKKGIQKAIDYLKANGVKDEEIRVNAVRTQTLYASSGQQQGGYYEGETFRQIAGYRLTQSLEVRSSNVAVVEKVARGSTELISSGVAFESDAPQFIYTKIGEVKIEILAEASKDARRRAEEIAKSAGTTLSDVRFARMAPLQITPIYDFGISSEGQNDTSSNEKAITAIVTMGFGVK